MSIIVFIVHNESSMIYKNDDEKYIFIKLLNYNLILVSRRTAQFNNSYYGKKILPLIFIIIIINKIKMY